jgi:hypothetical protein
LVVQLREPETTMTQAVLTQTPTGELRQLIGRLTARRPFTRRHLQIVLGLLWLLDGALQAQPFMFTRAFGTQLIAGTGAGQPTVVRWPVHFSSTVIAGHPFAWNLLFAAIQVLIGVGLLLRRTARTTLIVSVVWALGVWYLGEGLSGLASGHASIINGAPGSALLYAVLAVAAFPGGRLRETPARWLMWAWAALWVGAAVYQVLPGQNTGSDTAGVVTGGAAGGPHWLVQLDTSIGTWMTHNGVLTVVGLAVVYLLIGLGALVRATRTWSLAVGLVLAIAIWITGQDLGQLYSGQATDPNSAPLIVLMAVAAWATVGQAVRRTGARTS